MKAGTTMSLRAAGYAKLADFGFVLGGPDWESNLDSLFRGARSLHCRGSLRRPTVMASDQYSLAYSYAN